MRPRPAIDVTMLVPGLLGPGGAGSDGPDVARALVDGLDLRALDRLLARSGHAVETTADGSIEALAFRAFGHEIPPATAEGPDVPDAEASACPAAAGGPDGGAAAGLPASDERASRDIVLPAGAGGSATADTPRSLRADWPVAAVTALVDCGAPIGAGRAGPWLRVDPVHLRPDVADLVLFDAVDVGISIEEARALAETVNAALRPGGPSMDAAHPHRWYVALDVPARMATRPLSLARGERVSAAMPRGPDAPRWRRWMNEVQMALHDCPVNAERERRGAAPINSVWPWGGGSLPAACGAPASEGAGSFPPAPGTPVAGGMPAFAGRGGSPHAAAGAPAPFVRAWSDDALVRGLARHAGVECGALPGGGASPGDGASLGDAGAWLGSAPRPGAHLIAFDALYRAVRRSDLDGWRAGLARFSAAWAKPLLDALDRGAVARVSIRDERGHRFTATRWGRFRWWRRGGLAARIADAARHAR